MSASNFSPSFVLFNSSPTLCLVDASSNSALNRLDRNSASSESLLITAETSSAVPQRLHCSALKSLVKSHLGQGFIDRTGAFFSSLPPFPLQPLYRIAPACLTACKPTVIHKRRFVTRTCQCAWIWRGTRTCDARTRSCRCFQSRRRPPNPFASCWTTPPFPHGK